MKSLHSWVTFLDEAKSANSTDIAFSLDSKFQKMSNMPRMRYILLIVLITNQTGRT